MSCQKRAERRAFLLQLWPKVQKMQGYKTAERKGGHRID